MFNATLNHESHCEVFPVIIQINAEAISNRKLEIASLCPCGRKQFLLILQLRTLKL